MSKMMTWIGIMSGMTLLFYLGGVLTGTASTTLLDYVLNPQNLQNLPLYAKLLAIGSIAVSLGGLVATRLTGTDAYLWYPVVAILFTFGWDFLTIYQAMSASSAIGQVVALIIFGPIMLMYIISVVEWWRGIQA